jgi:hypothetical protein
MNHHDLAHLAEHHGINTKKKNGSLLSQEDILKPVKEQANCQPQYFEYFHCLDNCVSYYFVLFFFSLIYLLFVFVC